MKRDGEGASEIKRRRTRERTKEMRSKTLHGQFLMETDEIASESNWSWLRTGYLKKETEGFLVAAQSQAPGGNAIKAKIVTSKDNSLCCLCHQKNKAVKYIVSE